MPHSHAATSPSPRKLRGFCQIATNVSWTASATSSESLHLRASRSATSRRGVRRACGTPRCRVLRRRPIASRRSEGPPYLNCRVLGQKSFTLARVFGSTTGLGIPLPRTQRMRFGQANPQGTRPPELLPALPSIGGMIVSRARHRDRHGGPGHRDPGSGIGPEYMGRPLGQRSPRRFRGQGAAALKRNRLRLHGGRLGLSSPSSTRASKKPAARSRAGMSSGSQGT